MIAAPPGIRVYLACGATDMRRGMAGLAMQVQQVLAQSPFDGGVFAFRGKNGRLIKVLWHDGIGLCLLTKTAGARLFHLADDQHWHNFADGSPAGDVAGRLRVARTSHKLQTGTRRLANFRRCK